MVCTFFGHRDAPLTIADRLENEILALAEKGVETFLVGNNGNFDFMVQNILNRISKSRNNMRYMIVLSRISECAISGNQSFTTFPEGFEKFHPKFAISKRNEYLIKNSNIAIVYLKDKYSNCFKWTNKAISNGLTIINIAN